jgi:hypothetical protein
MKKILLLVSLLVALVLVVGCSPAAEVEDESVTIESEDGTVEITGSGGEGWCDEGSEWKMDAVAEGSDVNAVWMIKGQVSSGEYAGLCHVEYSVESEGQEMTADYYFSEGGETGYIEMEINGEVMKTEWGG